MKFLNKLERKFGKYAIQNLTLFLIGAYVIGYIFTFVNEDMMTLLTLNPYYIVKGQVWRLITWVLVPPTELNFFTIIMLYFYYSVGMNLERTWGSFRYNFYIFGGMLLTVIGAFLLYFAYEWFLYEALLKEWFIEEDAYQQLVSALKANNMDISGFLEVSNQKAVLCEGIFGGFSTYYINLSIFLAFAASYPDVQVMLYFLIPLKIKWLAYLDVAYLIYHIYQYAKLGVLGIGYIVAIVVSLLNFIIFFFLTRNVHRISPKEVHRRNAYKRQVHQAQFVSKHKCAICGRTGEEDDTLEFRFCSKCNGNYEYCQHHLFTHEHVK